MKEINVEIERDNNDETQTYVRVVAEEQAPTNEEKIINRFFKSLLDSKEKELLEKDGSFKVVVTMEAILNSWNDFKKEWYENKNA